MAQLKSLSLLQKYVTIKTIGDGHCLLHSIHGSWIKQIPMLPPPSLHTLKCMIFTEVSDNVGVYTSFSEAPNNTNYGMIHSMRQYILNKTYNTQFGDMVGDIVANSMGLSLHILKEDRSSCSSS